MTARKPFDQFGACELGRCNHDVAKALTIDQLHGDEEGPFDPDKQPNGWTGLATAMAAMHRRNSLQQSDEGVQV